MNRLNKDASAMTAGVMLNSLRQAHADVRACIDEMEILTSKSTATQLEYTSARFRISKASMARRSLFNSICAEFRKNAVPSEAEIIDQLSTADRELARRSAEHVKQWSTEAVAADWQGYRLASRQIRARMAMELDAEARLLFPLLERRSLVHWSPSERSARAA
jgi:hypothetical protein